MHNNLFHNLINGESKITQDEVRNNVKHQKDKIFIEKIMKEKEIMKIDRQMDEYLCNNVHNVCADNSCREESEKEQKYKLNKERNGHNYEMDTCLDLHDENSEHIDELNQMKRYRHKCGGKNQR